MARSRKPKQDRLKATDDSRMTRAGSLARDNPVAAGGTIVMALTGCLIIANAVGFQSQRHPAPLFASRDRPVVDSRTNDPDAWRSVNAPVISALVLDIQQEMRRIGLYEGPLDGLDGPATERAIRRYQRLQALPETGEATEALLAMIALQGPVPTEPSVPIPRPKPGPAVRGSSGLLSTNDPDVTASIPQAAPQAAQASPSANLTPEQERLARVQQVLSELGYGPLVADGVMGENTSAAIRRFELDRGLPLSGEPSRSVIERLEMVSGKKLG